MLGVKDLLCRCCFAFVEKMAWGIAGPWLKSSGSSAMITLLTGTKTLLVNLGLVYGAPGSSCLVGIHLSAGSMLEPYKSNRTALAPLHTF